MAESTPQTGDEMHTDVEVMAQELVDNLVHAVRSDGLMNVLSGLGGQQDKSQQTKPDPNYYKLTRGDVDILLDNDYLAGKIVEKVPEEATKKGWTVRVSDDPKDSKPFDETMESIGLRQSMKLAHTWARAYGGGAVILGVFDGAEDMSHPVNTDNIKGIYWTIDADRWELTPKTWYTDPWDEDGNWGKVKTYLYTPHNTDATRGLDSVKEIHESRILRFEGRTVPKALQAAYDYWGQTYLQRVWEVIRRFHTNSQMIENVLHEARQGVVKMAGLANKAQTKEGQEILQKRLLILSMFRSALKVTLVDKDNEDFEDREIGLGANGEAWGHLAHEVAAAADMSMTVIWGMAPAGLTSDDKGGRTNWYDTVETVQTNEYSPHILRVAKYLAAAEQGPTGGIEPDEMEVHHHPLETPTEKEEAETQYMHAQRDQIYLYAGVLRSSEVRESRFRASGYSNDIVLQEGAPSSDPEDPPEGTESIEAAGQAAEAASEEEPGVQPQADS